MAIHLKAQFEQLKLKPLAEQVLVITGASSGIGLATALCAARRGARVVLASRNEQVLKKLVDQICTDGGLATHVVADVAIRDDLEKIARTAVERFGGLDTWINNAGVEVWGRIEDGSDAVHRRLFETNFWGVVYGSLTAVKYLRESGGALINIGSVESDRALPLQGIYSASKHAVKGFTDSLRMELEKEGAPIAVTLIKPSSIATPLPQHAENYMKKEIQLAPPLYRPEDVAEAILHAAVHPVRDVVIGGGGRLMSTLGQVAPRVMDRISETLHFKAQMRDEPAHPHESNLYGPTTGGEVEGEHPGQWARHSLYTNARLHPMLVGGLISAAAGLAMISLLPHRRSGFGSFFR